MSKVSITLGLSSASIAATESQFSISSSSRLLSLIVPSASTSSPLERSPAGLNGVAVAGAVAGRDLWRPPGLARTGDPDDQLAGGASHRRRRGLGVRAGISRIEVDDVAQ